MPLQIFAQCIASGNKHDVHDDAEARAIHAEGSAKLYECATEAGCGEEAWHCARTECYEEMNLKVFQGIGLYPVLPKNVGWTEQRSLSLPFFPNGYATNSGK